MENTIKVKETARKVEENTDKEEKITCPVCGSESISIVSRCVTCYSCGWSACSL